MARPVVNDTRNACRIKLMGRPLVDADERCRVAAGCGHRRSVVGITLQSRSDDPRTHRDDREDHAHHRRRDAGGVRLPGQPESLDSVPRRRRAGEARRRTADLGDGPARARRHARRRPGGARGGDEARGLGGSAIESTAAAGSESLRGVAPLGTGCEHADDGAVHGEPRVHRALAALRRQRCDAGVRTHRHARSGDHRAHRAWRQPRPRRVADWLPKRRCSHRSAPSPALASRDTRSAG